MERSLGPQKSWNSVLFYPKKELRARNARLARLRDRRKFGRNFRLRKVEHFAPYSFLIHPCLPPSPRYSTGFVCIDAPPPPPSPIIMMTHQVFVISFGARPKAEALCTGQVGF